MNRDVRDYLSRLASELARLGHDADRLCEIESHFAEAIASLRASGLDEITATRIALERFGTVDEVVRAFEPSQRGTHMLYKILTPLAVFNTGSATLIATARLWHPTDYPGVFAMLLCALVVAHAVLVFCRPTRSPWIDLQFGGAFVLVAFGTAAVLWTIHLGHTTGDFEWWSLTFAAGCVAQGLLSGWTSWSNNRKPHIVPA